MAYTVGDLSFDTQELVGGVFPDEVIIKARKSHQDLLSLTISKRDGEGVRVAYQRADEPFDQVERKLIQHAQAKASKLQEDVVAKVKQETGLSGYQPMGALCPETIGEGLFVTLVGPFLGVGGGLLFGTAGGVVLAHLYGANRIIGGIIGTLAGIPLGVVASVAYAGICVATRSKK